MTTVSPSAATLTSSAWAGGTDHKTIGRQFIVVSVLFLLVGGALGLLMRAQGAAPDLDIVGPRGYRQLFTIHGVVLVFLFLLPMWLGLASAVVPLQVGARGMAFPRAHALSLWLFVVGGAMVVAAPLASDVASGWTLSSPLPEGRGFGGQGPDLLILGLALVCAAAVVAVVNLLATMLQLRAPAMPLRAVPLFSWSVLASGAVLLLALPVLVAALAMLFVDRHYGGHVFNGFTGSRGGNPLLWPRMFWFAAYPVLWALVLPALGALCEVVPVFARRPLFSRARAATAVAAVAVLSFAGWGAEVPSLVRARPLFALGGLAVLAPLASLLLNWFMTAVGGSRRAAGAPRVLSMSPMLHALAAITVLAAGLLGGAVAAVDAGGDAHRTYWSVATQHTLFFGFSTLGAVAALSYWAPKLWGRHMSEGLGKLQVLALVGGMHLTFLPMFVLGAQGMAARTATFDAGGGWGPANAVATAGAFVLGLGVVLFVVNFLGCAVAGWGRRADADPWGGRTLEWATSSPPPPHNFDSLPALVGGATASGAALDRASTSAPALEAAGR
ncbi:MAG: cbb3-type cytochrome c oxidase subunit I [Acidimicrobiales bacterium]